MEVGIDIRTKHTGYFYNCSKIRYRSTGPVFSTTSVVHLSEVGGNDPCGLQTPIMVRRHGRLPIRQHLALREDVSMSASFISYSAPSSQLVTEKMLFEGGKCIHIYQGNGR